MGITWQAYPEIGDRLYFERLNGMYYHCAIYIGKGRVIHYSSDPRNGLFESVLKYLMGQVTVRTDCISDVVGGSPIYIFKSFRNAAEIEKMIQDALQRVGEKAYSILLNNCLHFCEEITGNGTVPPDIRTLERVRVTESDWNERCETPLSLSSHSSPGYNIEEINLMNNTGLQNWQGNGTSPLTNFFGSGAKTLTQDYSGGYIDTINLINTTGLQEWRQGNETCSLTNSYWGGAKTVFTQDYLGGYIDTINLINNTGLQEWRQGNGTCSLTNSYCIGTKTLFTQDYLGGYIDTILELFSSTATDSAATESINDRFPTTRIDTSIVLGNLSQLSDDYHFWNETGKIVLIVILPVLPYLLRHALLFAIRQLVFGSNPKLPKSIPVPARCVDLSEK